MTKLVYDNTNQTSNPWAGRAGARKASKIWKQRSRNYAIDKIMKKRKPQTTDRKQTNAIYTLSKQVKRLQFQSFGDKQYQFQYGVLNNESTVPNSTPLITRPIFFAANCFYSPTKIYRGYVDAALQSQYAQAGNNTCQFSKQPFDLDIANEYQWNEQNNQGTVSKVEYLPEYMKYKFRFMGTVRNAGTTIRYRITFLKLKNIPMQSTTKDFALPGAAGAYWHLCDDSPASRNYFSKSYHEVLADRWVIFSPPTDTGGQLTFNKTIEIPFSFKRKVPLKPNITTAPPSQDFIENLPSQDVIWCVISSNQTDGDNAPTIFLERNLQWRDKHGTTVGVPSSTQMGFNV